MVGITLFDKKEYMKKHYQEHKEYYKEKHKKWFQDNIKSAREHQKQQREQIKQYINNYKLSRGCSVCGYNKCAAALDFHHNGDKECTISQAIVKKYGEKRLKKEIDKCIVLCANCHRELHNK